MKDTIQLLYVDDEPTLLEIGKVFLERFENFQVFTEESALSALDILNSQSFDAIISDYQMPKMDGIEFLKVVRKTGNKIPFILFTGKGREEVVIEALNEGADFYLQKGGLPKSQFAELAHKVRQAVKQRRLESSIRDHEQLEADIMNFLPDATLAINSDGIVIAWNRAMEQLTGVQAGDILGKGDYEYSIPFYLTRRPMLIDLVLHDDPETSAKYSAIKKLGENLSTEITLSHFHEGTGASFWFCASPLYDNQGGVVGAIESIREITENKRAEAALRLDEARLEKLLELHRMIDEPEQVITRFALDEAVRLTESTIGYIAFVHEDESELTMYSWSEKAMKECQVLDKPRTFKLANTGLWGESLRQRRPVVTNDYAADSPLKKGIPKGHVHLTRHLGIPVFDGDRIVIVAGVGNKEKNYEPSDIRQLNLLMSGMWGILQRKRSEQDLLRKNEEIMAAYEEITATEEELRANYEELVQQEKELHRNEQQFQSMAGNVPGVVYRVHAKPDGTFIFEYISDQSIRILGIENNFNTFLENFFQGIIQEDQERFKLSMQDVVKNKKPWDYEGWFQKPSGERIWLKIVSNPIMEYGNLIFDGIIFDDTDRRKRDELVRLLAKISDEFPASVTVHDYDGNMLYANEQTFLLHGYTSQEFLSKNLHELDALESEQLINERMKMLQERNEIEFDAEHYHKNGSIIPLHVFVKKIAWEGKDVLLSIATRLTP
ncbi:PAS domain-containing protein [Methanospirillum stamsii]|nr:PAS domain-containing protein [Methanospirillum stamsii]